ncbi:MAG: hypothetical protein H6830_09415 [Planctomycetes bacterium]|nr:hypothetical protein [Planctomycetota bacterium]MCB9909942.1 hypothetical protein [Planctomycetota bacterium]MCB9912921.1 hypothetical protein [Planctomycetota bacterium]HPF14959.1 hypothetical protein [Planctomycetota bacterium]
MASRITQSQHPKESTPTPGSGLRARVESLGLELETRFSQLLSELPRRIVGPQVLANTLGITTVTASRFLKAISQSDPVAIIQLLPGPNPLQRIITASKEAGVSAETCDATSNAVQAFDELIRSVAGDRSSLKAMLTAWLPEERREFEAQRRQSVFKAMCELNGVSSETALDCLLLHPSETPEAVDIVNIKCLLGIDRIRPDAVVHFGTWRVASQSDRADSKPRVPLTLAGKPALEGLDAVRMDEFCNAPPAPLHAERLDEVQIQYSLAPTGFGPASKVDLVIAELNRGELIGRKPNAETPPYFFGVPEMATRKFVFDLLVHKDVYPGCTPSLLVYDTMGHGPARAGDKGRRLSLRDIPEELESVGTDHRRLRVLEFPAYPQLRERVFQKLGWDAGAFRAYRIEITYPLMGTQITLAFQTPAKG